MIEFPKGKCFWANNKNNTFLNGKVHGEERCKTKTRGWGDDDYNLI